jgi:primosomal protein N' (replication factor Y)
MQPQHYSISLAANHRYEELARKELEIRRQAGFPPFVRLVSIRVEGLSEDGTRRRALEIGSEARRWVKKRGYVSDIAILGPAPAPLEKLRNMFRWQVLLKADQLDPLHDLADHCLRLFKNKGAEKVILDVDPENML